MHKGTVNSPILFDQRFGKVIASFARNMLHTSHDKLAAHIRKQFCCRKIISRLSKAPTITKPMSEESFYHFEFSRILSSRCNGLKPGPNRIPYKVYKKLPYHSHCLFAFFFIVRGMQLSLYSGEYVSLPTYIMLKTKTISNYRPSIASKC